MQEADERSGRARYFAVMLYFAVATALALGTILRLRRRSLKRLATARCRTPFPPYDWFLAEEPLEPADFPPPQRY